MRSFVALILAVLLGACASTAPPIDYVPGVAIEEAETAAESVAKDTPKDTGQAAKTEESRGFFTGAVLYLPNRIVDLFDIAKVGVDIGPGLGIDVQATRVLQARAMWNLSFGVGFQGLRHLPFQAGTVIALGVGPIGGVGDVGGWSRSTTGFRVGLHVLIVGAHAEVDPYEILDFVLGFFTIDIAGDDF